MKLNVLYLLELSKVNILLRCLYVFTEVQQIPSDIEYMNLERSPRVSASLISLGEKPNRCLVEEF